ncbi:hypothetical protein SAMN04515647_3327 [Cohaesibacter sp. ES.047]|uniref:hypothetical protein n=1 Tax=Cohaesibacter sp. ES.047 TaxID=1798205 RepID=UPI000BB6FC00|nr:hypothetical protein [Cohaesibacter sp. ES.047]SNY93054.1 hypothetical protein SAMN04515647_3327 [Cohaesibacter sp. ES.047]
MINGLKQAFHRLEKQGKQYWNERRADMRIDRQKLGVVMKMGRQYTIQLCLYAMILTGAVGVTFTGSEILMGIIHTKMTEMSQEVIAVNTPKSVRTASLRLETK